MEAIFQQAKFDEKLEDAKATAYAESVDVGMENHILKRALWLARANSADGQFIYWCARFGVESGFTKADVRGYSVNTKRKLRMIREWIEVWKNVRSKCLKKAEAYTESVDAGMRERRLKRALWHAIALFCARSCEYFNGIMSHCLMGQDDLYKRCEEKKNKYLHAMYKCRAKEEEYK